MVLISNLILKVLNYVSTLLATVVTSDVAHARDSPGGRLVNRKVNGLVSNLFNKVPNTNTAVNAIMGVRTKKHATLSNLLQTIVLLVIIL